MAFSHGKDAALEVDSTNITSFVNQQSLNKMKNLFETTTFGVDDKTFIDGLREHALSIGGPWDPTLDAAMDAADDGAVVPFKFAPAGSGAIGYNGSAFLENYRVDVPVGSGVTWSASFKPSGSVTRATQTIA